MSTTSSTAMTPIAADITSETLVAVGETTVETDHMKDGSFTFATEIGSTTVDRLGRLIHVSNITRNLHLDLKSDSP